MLTYNWSHILLSVFFVIAVGKLLLKVDQFSFLSIKAYHYSKSYIPLRTLKSIIYLQTSGQCCDDMTWKNIGSRFVDCINKTEKELLIIEETNSIEALYSNDYCRYESYNY